MDRSDGQVVQGRVVGFDQGLWTKDYPTNLPEVERALKRYLRVRPKNEHPQLFLPKRRAKPFLSSDMRNEELDKIHHCTTM